MSCEDCLDGHGPHNCSFQPEANNSSEASTQAEIIKHMLARETWGTPDLSASPVPNKGKGERGSCLGGPCPSSRPAEPRQHNSREDHFDWHEPHKGPACVMSCNLLDTFQAEGSSSFESSTRAECRLAKAAWGAPYFSASPVPSGGGGERGSCLAGSCPSRGPR